MTKHAEDLAKLGWQYFECPACGSEGARAFPKPEQPAQQEPVAFLVDGDLYYPEEIDWETLQEQGHTVAPLYTSPPAQRTWVGLTDEEQQAAYDAWQQHY